MSTFTSTGIAAALLLMTSMMEGKAVNVAKEQQNYDKKIKMLLIDGGYLLGPFSMLAAHLLRRYLFREVERVDAETPQVVQKRLLCLPQFGEAELLLRKLERMRTDVLHAMNAIGGVPKSREQFADRLKRMKKQGKVPDKIFRQVQVLTRYRNRAIYESYHLTSDEMKAVEKAFDEVGEWTRKVGYVY